MRSVAIWTVIALMVAACTLSEPATIDSSIQQSVVSTTEGESNTSTSTGPTSTAAASGPPSATVTTLAQLPDALPIVVEEWGWAHLVEAEIPDEVRYDGTYLAYTYGWGNPLVVMSDGVIVLEHQTLDDKAWIIQDVELGDHWLGVVENTEGQAPDRSRLVVYDVRTGDIAVERVIEQSGQRLTLPAISISWRLMAVASSSEDADCFEVYDLAIGYVTDKICGDSEILGVELDANAFAFDTLTTDCTTVWTGTVYGFNHDLTSHANRECWSSSPGTSGEFTVWFENPPNRIGIDTMIGEQADGTMVGLGTGDNGTLEVCWNRAYWLSGDNDVRMWDGGDTVQVIYEAGYDRAYQLGCVGPWVTFRTMDAIYTANMVTQAATDPCAQDTPASREQETKMSDELTAWVHERFDDPREELNVSVSGPIGADGWWIADVELSNSLESAIFLWHPDGNISIAFSGTADTEYEIREYMLSALPDAPAQLLGCIDVHGYY